MLRLIVLRVLAAVPVLMAAAVVTFVLFQVVPGDAALVAVGERGTLDEVAALRREVGLDAPPLQRVVRSFGRLAVGDLGTSLRNGRPVTTELAERAPYTLALTLGAVGIAVVIGPIAGAVAAARRGQWPDVLLSGLAAVLLATPVFAVALPLVTLFAVRWGVLPVAGALDWRHAVLPVATLALPSIAAITRVSRAAFVEALSADYVRAARAKGLAAAAVYAGHVWPNVAPPVLALTGVHLGSLLGGAVVVETLFAWPGLGRLAVGAILTRDFPLAQGVVLTLAAGFILANLLADLVQRAMDPRLR